MTPVRLRAMTRGDLADGRSLLSQLGYEVDAAELERRTAAVAATPDHALIVAEAAGRVVGLLHVFARPMLENPLEAVVAVSYTHLTLPTICSV